MKAVRTIIELVEKREERPTNKRLDAIDSYTTTAGVCVNDIGDLTK